MKRWAVTIIAVFLLTAFPLLLIQSTVHARVASVAGVCLYLWISDAVPPFVPTLLLLTLIPLVLGPLDPKYSIGNVLTWTVDPVMALFLGGFALGVGTEAFGFDRKLARLAFRSAGKSFAIFLLLVMLLTAFLSMWLSNIAAAALVLACLRPLTREFADDHLMRRALLVGVAFFRYVWQLAARRSDEQYCDRRAADTARDGSHPASFDGHSHRHFGIIRSPICYQYAPKRHGLWRRRRQIW